MATQYFQGTIGTLANLIEQEKRQRFMRESPEYQQALFNLMQTKEQVARLQAFRQQIASGQLSPAQIAQQGAMFAAGEGQLQPVMQLQEQEFQKGLIPIEGEEQRKGIPIHGMEQRKAAVPGIMETFQGLQPGDLQYYIEKGTFPEDALPRIRPRPGTVPIDPYTRALLTTLGAGAGKAQISLQSTEAITGDIIDTMNNFLKIPADLRGPLAGRTAGQVAKLGQEDVVTYEGTKELMLANIAKQLGGEVGVLTDRDISRIEKALPQLQDNDDAARRKMQFVLNYVDRRVRAKQATGGLPVTGITIPEDLRDPNFNPDNTTIEQYINKAKGKIPLLPRTGQQQPPLPQGQTETQQPQNDELDNYLKNLGL